MRYHLALALVLLITSHLAQSLYIDTSSGPSSSCLLQTNKTSCIQHGCEWAETHCEVTCESLAVDSICLLFDKCEWTSLRQCKLRGTLCYQLEFQEACERTSDCVWNEQERACVEDDKESIPINPSGDICAFMIMESSCNLYDECIWNGVQCLTKSDAEYEAHSKSESPSASPSISTIKDETEGAAIAPSAPPSAQTEVYCNNDSSEQACESGSVLGITCVYSDGRCRVVHDRLMPASNSILNQYSLIWTSAHAAFAAAVLPTVAVIKRAIKKTHDQLQQQARVSRLIQAILAIGAIVLFAVNEQPTNVIVPLLATCASVATVIFCAIANMGLQPGMDFAMYMMAIVVSASASNTSEDSVLAASILLTFACIILPAFLYCLYHVKQQLDSNFTNSNAIIGARILAMAFALSILVMSSSTPIVVTVAWISGIVVLTVQLILFGLCAFSIPFTWILFALDIVSCTIALVGSIEANYTNSNLAISIVSILLVGIHGFATATAAMQLLLPLPAPPQQKHVFKSSNGPRRRSPAKQKIFATPAEDVPSVESPIQSKPSPIPVRFEPESFLGMVYLESRSLENSLNSQNQSLSPRRRMSSADYKREMAIV